MTTTAATSAAVAATVNNRLSPLSWAQKSMRPEAVLDYGVIPRRNSLRFHRFWKPLTDRLADNQAGSRSVGRSVSQAASAGRSGQRYPRCMHARLAPLCDDHVAGERYFSRFSIVFIIAAVFEFPHRPDAVRINVCSDMMKYQRKNMLKLRIRAPTQLYIDSVNQFYPYQERALNHVNQLMAYHPLYQEPFVQTQEFVMQGDGPLPYDQRHYIALLAAARHQCTYLAEVETQEYLSCGGEKAWLQGLEFAPKKIRDLDEINQLLAHRPWMISKEHILKLTTGNDSWSLAEVVHAITILAHFHALSSFVFGCGISHQTTQSLRLNSSRESLKSGGSSPVQSASPAGSPSHNGSPIAGGEVENLMRKMRTISESKSSQDITCEELARRFESEATESASISTIHSSRDGYLGRDNDLTRFVCDPAFTYQDFTKRGEAAEVPTFRIQDYSWDDHGYSLLNRLYNDVGKLLDKKFKVAYNMTYYTMGGKTNVDTSMFRRAVWNYIHCLFGIRHDDYDYREVNELLDGNLKQYIKSVCCYPERVSKQHYESVMREFKYSEKVHVTLMILEARMQAELLYALRALMRHTT